MVLTSGIWAIRVVIVILTAGGCANTLLDYESATYEIDRFNAYISFAVVVSYAYALISKRRLVGIYVRAALFILIAFIWFSFNLTWSCNRCLHGREFSRLDVTVAMPTSILIIIESVMTVKWEARLKRREEVIQSCRDQEMMMAAGGAAGSGGVRRYGGMGASFWPSRPLRQDEQDNIEVIIPVNLQYPPPSRMSAGPDSSVSTSSTSSSGDDDNARDSDQGSIRSTNKSEMYQRPAQAYFPAGTSLNPSSSSSGPSSSSGRGRQQHQHLTSVTEDHPSDDQLPPYSRH